MYVLFLFLAILMETAATTSLKLSQGFTRAFPTVTMVVFYGLSFLFLAQAIKRLDMGLVYAVWAGAGTALIAIVGILWFREPLTLRKVGALLLIILGVIGLRLSQTH